MLKEFKEFAMRGNVLDMAIGVILGGAFGKIVSSLVNDILMPPIGLVLGRVDFSNLFLDLSRGHHTSVSEAKAAGAATINYGMFLNTIVDFFFVSFAVFLLVKQVNRLKRSEPPPAPPATKICPYCRYTIPIEALRCAFCTSELGHA